MATLIAKRLSTLDHIIGGLTNTVNTLVNKGKTMSGK